MTLPPAEVATTLGILLAAIAIAKACWAVAQFFIGLAEGLKNLTTVVTALAERFDVHASNVEGDLSDVRERVAGLESWRDSTERAA